ncbi:hypothetical protein HY772_01100 [Candidatus Woesearchaeota archaeon]|nr:hypothetical protein [Candidatus Woesearchaeota archaeon]
MEHKVGHYAFFGGVVLAVLAGVVSALFDAVNSWVVLALIVLGVLVGVLNVQAKEVTEFLVAVIALLLAGSANVLVLNTVAAPFGTILHVVLTYIKVFVAPAAVVVGLKAVKQLAER